MLCSSNYTNIAFGCTNTTYVDSNGDADGVTVFVSKDCATGKRFSYDQDVQYRDHDGNVPVLSTGAALDPYDADADTCKRGCICGYSANTTQTLSVQLPIQLPTVPAYLFCQCNLWLSNYLTALIDASPSLNKVLVTAANISLLDHYSVNYTGLVTTNSSTDAVPFQSPFECFGNRLTVGTAVFQYWELGATLVP